MRALAFAATSLALLTSACLIERQQIDRPEKPEPKPAVVKKPEPPPAPPLVAAQLFTEHAALQCMGNEPAWDVVLDADGAAYRDAETPAPRVYPAPQLRDVDGAIALSTTRAEADALALSIKRASCKDSMSDDVHPFVATLDLGARTLSGCCREPVKRTEAVLVRYTSLTCTADGGWSLKLTPTTASLTPATGQAAVDLGVPSGAFERGRLKVLAEDLTAHIVERGCGEGTPFAFRANHAGKVQIGCCAGAKAEPKPAPVKAAPVEPAPPKKAAPVLPNLKRKLPAVTPNLPSNLKVPKVGG